MHVADVTPGFLLLCIYICVISLGKSNTAILLHVSKQPKWQLVRSALPRVGGEEEWTVARESRALTVLRLCRLFYQPSDLMHLKRYVCFGHEMNVLYS